jgi:outer membrane protein assembly factor BamB
VRRLFASWGIALGMCGAAHAAMTPLEAQFPKVPEPVAWTSYGGDDQLQNSVWTRSLTRAAVTGLAPLWTAKLDGPIYASPLAFTVGARRFVFVTTEAGSVYALDAANGTVVWHRELGMVTTDACGTWGITSTGVIERSGRVLYVIGATGELHALSLESGDEAAGFPRRLVDNPAYEYVWGGLRIAAGRLYVPVASYCDVGSPDGFFPEGGLIGVPLDDPGAPSEWDAVPGPQNLGGIWGWGGVSVDPDTGAIYTAVGNSHEWSDECACYVDNDGYGDHVVELTPDLTSVLGAQSPGIQSTGDYDFGAAPVLFQPIGCPPLAAANNKNGTLYIWKRLALSDGPIAAIPAGDGVSAFIGTPAWSDDHQTLYEAQSVLFGSRGRLGNGVRAFRVEAGCRFVQAWAHALGDGTQATPLVVGDVLFATGGKPGGFYALSTASGALLWSYPTPGRTVAVMISVGGTVFGADTDGTVYAFRPRTSPPR